MKVVVTYLFHFFFIFSMSLPIFPQALFCPILCKQYDIHMEIIHILMVTILFTKINGSMIAAHMDLQKVHI